MTTTIKTIDAFRNKHIPERFLTTSSQPVLDMFENQVCVCLKASSPAFNVTRFEVEDEIRGAFMARINDWVKSFPTENSWSVVNHGIVQSDDYDFICTLGFVFSSFQDSETFLKSFVLLDKLSN